MKLFGLMLPLVMMMGPGWEPERNLCEELRVLLNLSVVEEIMTQEELEVKVRRCEAIVVG